LTLADDLPVFCWTALAVGWACARFSPATAAAWGASIGLLCDLTSQGRLGPHLAAYGLAVSFCLWIGTSRPFWFGALLGGFVSVADSLAGTIVPVWLQSERRIETALLSNMLERGIWTAAMLALLAGIVRLGQRLQSTTGQSNRPTLANQWTMLHEG
jgi:hypothetical protein